MYEGADLDEGEYGAMSPGARAAAERELRKRDRQEALASGRMRPGLLYEESEDEESQPPLARRRRMDRTEEGMEFEEVRQSAADSVWYFWNIFPPSLPLLPQGPEIIENLEDMKGHTVREWVSMGAPRAEIKTRFKNFLRTYVNEMGVNVYKEKIRQMCEGVCMCVCVCVCVGGCIKGVLERYCLKSKSANLFSLTV